MGEAFIILANISQVYRYLGFEISNNYDENERKENIHIPIFRLPICKNTKDLETAIQFLEMRRNCNRQDITIKNKFVHSQLSKKLGTDYKNKVASSKIRRAKKSAIRKLEAIKQAQLHQPNSTALPNNLNLDVTISTEKTAKLFGYKSARTGTNIQRRLKNED
ncbi:hypothetical protein [Adhaeribacter pallidiroseus]|uniref:Uncharacterized protein n=1 Tax=Adhaeribacter pallidiroseus TaxID=2072847 RepID=A0A369Q604_9BACT|nr:hypothetical protein [Adhaeribacter pallidiroseus]RDC58727.1 hypothetical protein AHMF7616_05361 [Adhaeribacter pallidiroseus]